MTIEQAAPFYAEPSEDRIRDHLREIRRWKPDGFYYFRTHPGAHNLEMIMGPDLGVNLPAMPSGVSSEETARRFLIEMSEQLGLDRTIFKRQLTLKHTMKSLMGSHCIFELRDRDNREILPSFFAVHMDPHERVVMVHCAHQNSIEPSAQSRTVARMAYAGEAHPADALAFSPSVTANQAREDRTIDMVGSRAWEYFLRQKIIEQLRRNIDPTIQIKSVAFNYDIWLPDWNAQRYVRGCQAKVQTNDVDYVFLVLCKDKSWETVIYDAVSKLASSGLALGLIYSAFWSDGQELGSQLDTSRVVLRDLNSTRGGLHGRYASVLDNLTDYMLDKVDDRHWLVPPETIRSGFDRAMAYYHVDLAQRFFRQLGLTVLDEYPDINPLQVVLARRAGNNVGAGYRQDLKAIVLRQIDDGNPESPREWTMARDARIIYHEFVHAVTDSLARLQRIDRSGGDCENIRLLEMTQAVAMDEGLADYFACSLAQRHGGPDGEYGSIVVKAGRISWNVGERRLCVKEKADLKSIVDADVTKLRGLFKNNPQAIENHYYRWGTVWASYLWSLRNKLGADVADVIIAHSILFLSRWSGFVVGVCALVQADLLLFSGENRQTIIELSGLEIDLKVLTEDVSLTQDPLSVMSLEPRTVEDKRVR
jgi:hypothetical protein